MDLTSLATWFLLLGAAGTTFLILRVAALLLGGALGDHGAGDAGGHGADAGDPGADLALETGADSDVAHGDAGAGDAGHGSADAASDQAADSHARHEAGRWLTLQGLSAFAMGFGWLGYSLLAVVPAFLALAAATLFGAACAAGLGWVVARLPRLEESGTFRASRCVGQVGTVHRRIPAGGRGAVQVVAQGRLVTMEATSDDAIATGRRVLVFDVTGEHVLRVDPWDDADMTPRRAPRRRGKGDPR